LGYFGSFMSQERQTFHLLQPRPYPAKLSLVYAHVQRRGGGSLLRPAIEQFMGEVACETEVILVNDGSQDERCS